MSPGERTSSATNRRATSVRRRQLLAAAGATTSLGVAGCLGFGSDADSGNGTDGNGTEDNDESAGTGGDEGSDDGTNGDDSSSDDGNDPGSEEPDDWAEGGPPDREGWSVTFADRFEGGELDTDRWSFGAGYNVTCPGGSLECWEEDHAFVDGETERLVIETSDEPSGDREYTSAGVTSLPSFEQEFGYFEAKTRAPAVPGSLPAFWMWWNADGWGHRREIDLYEINGPEPLDPIHNVHVDCTQREAGEGTPEWRGGHSTLDDAADETFHVWGVEWSPETVTFYVDGEQVVHVDDDIIGGCLAGESMGLVCSTHVNEDMGDPTATEYPYTHEFEWVRAWQHADWE